MISLLGAGVFYVAAQASAYPFLLAGLFIVGLGFALQQTATQTAIMALGNPEGRTNRMSLGGGINNLGSMLGPVFFSVIIFSTKPVQAMVTSLIPTTGFMFLGLGGAFILVALGVWSILTGPLTPDYYAYTLTVDGVRTMDPKNPMVKQGINSLENMMVVPGPETAFEDNKMVPHGEVREVWYSSNTLGRMRRMYVYTPPGYEKGTGKYPVFYLLHGGGDDDSGWNTIGRSGFILDNLIAAGKAKPMIVVMPNGSMPLPAQPRGPTAESQNRMRTVFSRELLNDILPTVEKIYRVLTTPENRALAGLSMGGFQTMDITLTHPELFDYVGVFSSGFLNGTADGAEATYAKVVNDPSFNKGKKLFWISVGKDDFLVKDFNKQTLAILDKHHIKYQYKESAGGHTWVNWRQYLNDYTPLLFK